MPWGVRVSPSDWLAFQARIRGGENPRLLRDRPADGAALVCENACGGQGRRRCAGYGGRWVVRGWHRKDVGVTVHAVGCQGQSFRLASPSGLESGSLKTPGY